MLKFKWASESEIRLFKIIGVSVVGFLTIAMIINIVKAAS